MKKVRVFDLAKDYGMKGPDLAKLLREIGFDKIKTHMTVLDDGDLMLVEARLSAQGHKKVPPGTESAPAGLPKKKSLTAIADDSDDAAVEAAPTPARKELVKKALPQSKAPAKKTFGKPDAEVEDVEPAAPVVEAKKTLPPETADEVAPPKARPLPPIESSPPPPAVEA
ncbi:MAG: translation initiation factor IF-2 N-terminal domain-containing protein, partial [Planctomycetota bacterium]